MSSKIKNTIFLLIIAAVLVLVYIFFPKKAPDQPNLISTANPASATSASDSVIGEDNSDFLNRLLYLNKIQLDDSIFSSDAWKSLENNTIVLEPDPNPGRVNPFAPLGSDVVPTPVVDNSTPQTSDTAGQPAVN